MRNHYSLSEFVKSIYSFVITKITMKQARLIRRPFYCRGYKSLSGCEGLTTGRFCRFDLIGTRPTLFIGKNCEFGDMTHIVAHEKVRIGDNVLIASKCFISDVNHGSYSGDCQDSPFVSPKERQLRTSEVNIGNNVWIGENAVILAGSRIGNGCIIGANSIISKAIPDNCIAIGANTVIKEFNVHTNRWERRD